MFSPAGIREVFEYLKSQIKALDIFKVVENDLSRIHELAVKFEECKKILVIGTGGSSLGGKCLVNFEAMNRGREPRVIFAEDTDARHFINLVNDCNPSNTGIIVISKSGHTTESLMLFSTLCELWHDFNFPNRALAITELSENNDLRILAQSLGMEVVEHNPQIGGRFSVFSVVGLLPALLGGVDIEAVVHGAQRVLQRVLTADTPDDCTLFTDIVSISQVFCKGTINQHVLMTYSDMLEDYGKWFVQLVSESLGKSEEFSITPIRALGTIDQHSMLQLFLGGSLNKFFTVVVQKEQPDTPRVNPAASARVLEHLRGRTIGELMLCHQHATIEVLKKKAPVRVLEFDTFNAETLGFLMMLSFVEVITIAKFAGVNPFDQPAVDEAKRLVLQYLDKLR